MTRYFHTETVLIFNSKGEPIAFVPRDFAEKHHFVHRSSEVPAKFGAIEGDEEETLSLFASASQRQF